MIKASRLYDVAILIFSVFLAKGQKFETALVYVQHTRNESRIGKIIDMKAIGSFAYACPNVGRVIHLK